MNNANREQKPTQSSGERGQSQPSRAQQRPLDDFEVRRTPSGAMEVVFCGSRYEQQERR